MPAGAFQTVRSPGRFEMTLNIHGQTQAVPTTIDRVVSEKIAPYIRRAAAEL
jgi:hypothetical protein